MLIENQLLKVDALVPCYNEEGRVGNVLKVLTSSKLIEKVVVVDDGSIDNSVKEIKEFKKVVLVKLRKNSGKGTAVKEGLKEISSPAVFLCDADVSGLKEKNIYDLVGAYKKNPRALVVGLREKNKLKITHWVRKNLLPLIAGERILLTNDLKTIVEEQITSGYGLEPYMNYYFKILHRPIKTVLLKGVNDIPKWQKKSYGLRPFLAEAANIVQKYLKIYFERKQKYPVNSSYKSSFINIDGIKLNYVKVGKGPILVFVHGWANNWESWIPIIPYLENSFTLYLLDLPGFGDSDNLPYYSIDSVSEYLAGFVKSLPGKPLSLIGLSMGSLVIGETGKRYPNLAKSVILLGPVIKNNERDTVMAQTLKYSLEFIRKFDASEAALKKIIETRIAAYAMSKYINMYHFNRFLVDAYGMNGKKKVRRQAFTQMGISGASYDLKPVLENYTIPTCLIFGREDKISSPKYAKKNLFNKNTLLKFVIIAKAGHIVPVEQPAKVAEAIKKFAQVYST